jgi:hypothetical protein
MKLRLLFVLLMVAFINLPNASIAAQGDTTKIRVHDAVHMSWWGEYKVWGVFPPAGSSFRRINLDFTLGCPSVGCSDWDYTVQVEALRKTGQFDSTLVQAPYYTVNNAGPATIFSNTNPVYNTFFNSTSLSNDSTLATTFWVMIHNDPIDPFLITDSMLVYPGNYYNYVYNITGTIIDSVLVGSNNTLVNTYTNTYNVFEIVERIELARVITPYGGYYNNNWTNTVHFDITDLAPILHDSVEIRAFYGGWSDGFAITLDFNFIEGTPPRTPLQVHNIYSSGPGGFPYGNATNSIENYLTPKTFSIGNNETNALLRIIPTGHGAGTQNCAEFCLKNYRIKLDGTQYFQQQIWRTDCGLNHLLHQAGTWIYDRANWCPGEKGVIREHEITPMITSGNNITIDMDLDAYTNTNTSQNPNYIMAAQLITFGNVNFTNDASMEEIISPNKDFYYNRLNPICSNPVVVIKNTGSAALTNATITYGIKGATPSTYQWTGNLAFNASAQVQLGSIDWMSLTNQSDEFYAYVSQPNGLTDNYAYNDTMHTYLNFPPQYAYSFVLLFQPNNVPSESSYNIKDAAGNTVFSNGPLTASTLKRDTIVLAPGCYTYNVNDSGKDGLSFFANNDGNGFTRFVNAFGPGVLKYFEADFGTRFSHQFTIGYLLSEPEIVSQSKMNVFPNPSVGLINIDISYPERKSGTIQIFSAIGKLMGTLEFSNTDNPVLKTDLSTFPAGIYFVKAKTASGEMVKKIVLQPGR